MAAITVDRDTPARDSSFGMEHGLIALSSHQFWKGGFVVLDQADGLLKKGTTATGLIAVGRCEETFLTGASNTRRVKARSGIFKWLNSAAGDAILDDDIGKDCFIVDDQTVALTSASSTRSRAGTIYGVDSDGVWVATGFPLT